jgi:hypothetical protein
VPSLLADLLTEGNPTIAADPGSAPDCWVAQVLLRDRAKMELFSPALDVARVWGQLVRLRRRVRQEHPARRRGHSPYDDDRLLDCLTEACAFAWTDARHPSVPVSDYHEGVPDIAVPPIGWIEAKAISPGREARAEFKRAKQGMVHGGGLINTGRPSRLHAVENAIGDAKRKLTKQQPASGIVSINLAELSFAETLVEDEIERDYAEWADGADRDTPSIKIALVRGCKWRAPFRQPTSRQSVAPGKGEIWR